MFFANIVKIPNMQKRHHEYIPKEKNKVVPLIQNIVGTTSAK